MLPFVAFQARTLEPVWLWVRARAAVLARTMGSTIVEI